MASIAVSSLEQYLQSAGLHEPDAEYVNGEILERPMGEFDHALWQKAILKWFDLHEQAWGIRVLAEYRVQVKANNYRVPDVVVFDRTLPKEPILTHPPIAVFEVLSPEDTIARMRKKLFDYEEMGIPAVFLVLPDGGVFQRFEHGNLTESADFSIPEQGIEFPFSEIAKFVD